MECGWRHGQIKGAFREASAEQSVRRKGAHFVLHQWLFLTRCLGLAAGWQLRERRKLE